MNGRKKLFKVVSIGTDSNNGAWLGQEHTLSLASMAGWNRSSAGLAALKPLKVGEKVVDEDGDTWERVA